MKTKKKILFLNVDDDMYKFLIKQISVNEFTVDVMEESKFKLGLIRKLQKYDYVFIDKYLKQLDKKEIKNLNIAYIDYNQDFFCEQKISQSNIFLSNLSKIYTYDSSKYDFNEKAIEVGNIYNDITRMIANDKKDISEFLSHEILNKKIIISVADKNRALKLKKTLDLNLDYEVFWNVKKIAEDNLQSKNYVINENLKLYIYNSDIIITDDDSIASYAVFIGKKIIKLNNEEKDIVDDIRNNKFISYDIKAQDYVMRNIVMDFLDSKIFKRTDK